MTMTNGSLQQPASRDEEQQLQKEAQALGRKIALLLEASDLPDETKAAIVELLPEMTQEQMDQLISLLTEQAVHPDANLQVLVKKLASIRANYDERKKSLDDVVLKELDELEKEI